MAMVRSRLARTAALAALLMAGSAGARPALYDLCVRGVSLDDTRTAHLRLSVDGADVAAWAPRLGALLVNSRYWAGSADEIYGANYDADLCGTGTAPLLSIEVRLTKDQAEGLGAAIASGALTLPAGYVAVVRRASPMPAPVTTVTKDFKDAAPDIGDPVRDAAGKLRYHLVRVYYATNRRPAAETDAPAHYSGERGKLSYGVVNVALPAGHRTGELEAPSILRLEFSATPDKHVVLQSIDELSAGAWRSEIAKRASALGNPGILVFVHGYNTTFDDAALRAGQLAFDLKFAGPTVLFSWPSRAATLEYTFDEQSAEWSVPDLQAVLQALISITPHTPVYVIAHSMGNRVFLRSFKALLESDPTARTTVKQIVLAAPDIDADVFTRELAPAVLGQGPRVTLYASSNDKALAASRDVHGGYRRLGESGKNLVVLQGLDTVDASTVSTEFLGHSYYGDSDAVVSDLKYVIRKSLPPQEREQFMLERVPDDVIGQYWRFRNH